ncbi:hypothetical protein [Cryobacterium sp. PAMC25264]|uniref:hypothetical protein n=1 Tax=Cryobacterium sp. PAMC25264 TaxID=2861288 RepID=UPI001C628775|nr:hypothetical protein [Cryobacterium sp. PAMC25264]QYF73758.1 hypothetical protein KY500_00210 [Cryobacterium sp. PAMC25264]
MYTDDDFYAIYRKPTCVVVCPLDGCGTRLIAKRNDHETRWLATHPGSVSCSHNDVPLIRPTGGGGPESDEHLWMKSRIALVCRKFGYDAVIEHQPTHADVFLPDSKIAIEYQRWDTKFDKRNLDRSHAGADTTLWFFPEPPRGLTTQDDKALDTLIKARIRQHGGIYLTPRGRGSRVDSRLVNQKPWDHPKDTEMRRTTRLFVSGSLVTYSNDRDTKGLKYAGSVGLQRFIREVVSGERTLQYANVRLGDGTVRRKVWVLASDLQQVAADAARAAAQKATAEKAAAEKAAAAADERALRMREEADRVVMNGEGLRADEVQGPALAREIDNAETVQADGLTATEIPSPWESTADVHTPRVARRSLWQRVKGSLGKRWPRP